MYFRRLVTRQSPILPFPSPTPRHPRFQFPRQSRLQSTKPDLKSKPPNTSPIPNINNKPTTTPPSKTHTRLTNLLNRLPRFLHPYTKPLLSAPLTHLTSFLILHELTAIIPILGLFSWFHWGTGTDVLPAWLLGGASGGGAYVAEGMEKFGRWFRRKGWFGFGKGESGGDGAGSGNGEAIVVGNWGDMGKRERVWNVGEKGSRILVEVATAYAITKVLLPVRILGSLWATPWFARTVLSVFGRLRRGKKG